MRPIGRTRPLEHNKRRQYEKNDAKATTKSGAVHMQGTPITARNTGPPHRRHLPHSGYCASYMSVDNTQSRITQDQANPTHLPMLGQRWPWPAAVLVSTLSLKPLSHPFGILRFVILTVCGVGRCLVVTSVLEIRCVQDHRGVCPRSHLGLEHERCKCAKERCADKSSAHSERSPMAACNLNSG